MANGAILSAAIALMHANLRSGQTPRDFFKGQSRNWSIYPGTQYTWKQLHTSLRGADLLDVLDLPADQTDIHIPTRNAEYKAEYHARPEVKAAKAEYNAEYEARPQVLAARAEY
jgi:hypothetical protein